MQGIIKCKCPRCGFEFTLDLPQPMWGYFVQMCLNQKCQYEAVNAQFHPES